MAFGFMSFTWFEERHEGQTLVDDVVTKHVPPHIGLFYCLGGIVFMALVAQFTSGLVLTFYFTPTVDEMGIKSDAFGYPASPQQSVFDWWTQETP
jgi:quinol-cytochrome oxidoreductase complex cytochrome b subunit